jgi:CheY-like chemotaxis protein
LNGGAWNARLNGAPVNPSPDEGAVRAKGDSKKRRLGKTALVADDNALVRTVLVAAFLSGGFKTCGEAENGEQAIRIAKHIKPDVIVLDLSMPVMNGLDAASKLRKIFPKTPIILFSLYANSLSKEDASRAGVSLVLPKSVPPSELVNKAKKLMRR